MRHLPDIKELVHLRTKVRVVLQSIHMIHNIGTATDSHCLREYDPLLCVSMKKSAGM